MERKLKGIVTLTRHSISWSLQNRNNRYCSKMMHYRTQLSWWTLDTTVTNHAAISTNSSDHQESNADTVPQVIIYSHLPNRKKKKKATNIGKAKLWFKPLPQVGISVTLPLALISYINGCNQKNTSENKAYAVSETLEQNNLCLLLVFLLREKKIIRTSCI